MKRLIVALVLFILSISISIFGYIKINTACNLITNQFDQIVEITDEKDSERFLSAYTQVESTWEKYRPFFKAFLSKEKANNLEANILGIKNTIIENKIDELEQISLECIVELKEIQSSVQPKLENIL